MSSKLLRMKTVSTAFVSLGSLRKKCKDREGFVMFYMLDVKSRASCSSHMNTNIKYLS